MTGIEEALINKLGQEMGVVVDNSWMWPMTTSVCGKVTFTLY